MKSNLTIQDIHVQAGDQQIISGVSLVVGQGQIHTLMGPNGSGKSTLAYAIAGHPNYNISQGDILIKKKSLIKLSPEARSQEGIFLSFQEPPEIGGIQTGLFLKKLISLHESSKRERVYIIDRAKSQAKKLSPQKDLLDRFLNKGFSGGEKKKSEMLQLLATRPKFAILDEIDSGLDIDSLKIIAKIIKEEAKNGIGFLLISHHTKLFNMLNPDKIHIIKEGKIVKDGTSILLKHIEKYGFAKL